MMALLRALRSLVFGETWTIPIGVAAAVVITALLRSAFSEHVWDEVGGFVLAGLIAATLVASISLSSRH
jgi:ABC-type phosphate/phosphonate transport system permease subunit